MSRDLSHPDESSRPSLRTSLAKLAVSSSSLLKSKALWRYVIILSLMTLLSMFLLGFAFFLIVTGVLMSLIHVAAVYRPARRLVAKIAGLPEGKDFFPQSALPLWIKALILLPVVFYAYLSGVGIWLLVSSGFLPQNLIYIALSK